MAIGKLHMVPPAAPRRPTIGISLKLPLPPKVGPSTGIISVRHATGMRRQSPGLRNPILPATYRTKNADTMGTVMSTTREDHQKNIELKTLVTEPRNKPTSIPITALHKTISLGRMFIYGFTRISFSKITMCSPRLTIATRT